MSIAKAVQTYSDLAQLKPGRYTTKDDGAVVIKNKNGSYDLDFQHVKRATTAADLHAIANGTPHIVFVYNPACGWCRRRYLGFDKAGSGMDGVWAFNAGPHGWDSAANGPTTEMFHRIVGLQVDHYPTVLGVSRQGRLLEYNGEVTKQLLKDFMKVLAST